MDMATKAANKLDDKTEIWELTDKQRVVVQALAKYPDKGPKEIAEIASENLDGDTVSRSYVHPIKDKYGQIVKKQREIKENERYKGTETTTGDPFENLDQTLGDNSSGWQTIQERPYKGESNAKDKTENEQNTIQADLSRADVESLLSGEVPENLRRELVIKIVDRAFRAD